MELIKEWINWLPLSIIVVAWLFMIANRGKAKDKAEDVMKDMFRENEKNLTEMRVTNKLLLEIVYLLKSK